MRSTKQNPLLALSKIEVKVHGSNLTALGSLGAGRRLMSIIMWMLIGMLAMFLAGGGIAAALGKFQWVWFVAPVLALSPWVVLLPILSRMIRRRASQALDTLLHNLTSQSR